MPRTIELRDGKIVVVLQDDTLLVSARDLDGPEDAWAALREVLVRVEMDDRRYDAT
jgi:hypothetical protein